MPAQQPLAKGISDVQKRIQDEQQQVQEYDNSVSNHVENFGEILYSSYGQEADPGRVIVELKKAYEDVHSAVENGLTGQVTPAVGKLGQALLDYWSETNTSVKVVNVFQQLSWEAAGMRGDIIDRNTTEQQLATDTAILQNLQTESAQIAGTQTGDATEDQQVSPPTSPAPPPASVASKNFSALDQAITLNQWLDQGDRMFDESGVHDQNAEDQFYATFPELATCANCRRAAMTGSPASEVQEMFSNDAADSGTAVADILQRARQHQNDLSNAENTAKQFNADLDAQIASAQVQAQALLAQQANGIKIAIPADWVPCTCPDQHVGAGIIVNGVQYHTPLLHCQ